MLSDSTSNPLVEELAESFVARFRQGERPSISEYTRQHPELARQIQEIFPALVAMEQVQQDIQKAVAPTTSVPSTPLLSSLGDYRIVREIGRGGMGIVYEAEQVSLGRRVALKVLSATMLGDPKHRKRFEREAKAAARLHHTNIVPVFGVGEQSGVCYYVMQYIHGQGLDDVLKELKQLRQVSLAQKKPALELQAAEMPVYADGPVALASLAASLQSGQFAQTLLSPESGFDVPPSESWNSPISSPGTSLESTAVGNLSDTAPARTAVHLPGQSEQTTKAHGRLAYWHSIARIGVQVASALQHAHEQGIIHRDIKPANLLLDLRGSVWVTDFGLAKATDQQDLTHSGDVLGTLRYMAPEQFDGAADPRSDLYSLGLTLYELLALRPAFDQSERQKLIKQVTTGSPPQLRSMDPDIPRDLETVIQKAIDRDPNHRYQTAAELEDDLSLFLGDEPIKARRISLTAQFRRWCRKNPVVAALSSTIALLITTAAVTASIAAVRFEKLAGDLQAALGSAQSNLTLANSEKKRAEEALTLVTAEQQRAEGNLDLALKAMDAVYLEAIGTEKLLGEAVARPEGTGFESKPKRPLSDLEKDLLKRGLAFYDQFAQQNAATPKATAQTAQAYYRVGLIHAVLKDNEAGKEALRQAIDRFEALLAAEPTNVDYLIRLADSHNQLAAILSALVESRPHLQRSKEYCSKALSLAPESSELYRRRASLHLLLGDMKSFDDDTAKAADFSLDVLHYQTNAAYVLSFRDVARAKIYAERSVAIAPNQSDAAFAMACANRNDMPKFLSHLNRTIELAPDHYRAYELRARHYVTSGNLELALADISSSLKISPEYIEALMTAADIHRRRQELELAELYIHRAIAQNSNRAVAYHHLGDVKMAQNKISEALDAYNNAISREAGVFYWHKRRAVAYFALHRPMEALQDLKTSFELNPKDGSAVWWIPASQVAACPSQEFKDGMLQFATEAIERNPGVRSARMRLAFALGRMDLAREDMAELAKAEDATYRQIYELALMYLTDGWNFDSYKSACQQMFTKHADSSDLEAVSFTGWTCALVPGALQDYAPALTMTQRAIEKAPKNADLLRSLGALQLRAGLHQAAIETLSPLCEPQGELASDKSSNSYPLFFLAMAQYQAGQKETAKETLTRAVTLAHQELSKHETLAWNRKLTLELLRDEAVALIGPVDVPPPLGPRIPPAPEPATTLPESNPGK